MTDVSASKMRPALIGGLVLGVASGIPFVNALNCACCLWVIVGGIIASYLYTKDSPVRVEYGDAAVLGLLTGVFGAVIATIVSLPLTLMFNIGGSEQLARSLEELRSNPDVPPEMVDFFEMLVDSGVLSAGFSVVGLLISIVIYALFAMLGAIIGAALFQKDKGTAPPPPSRADSGTPPPPAGMGGSSASSGSASGGGTPPPPGGGDAPGGESAAAPPPAEESRSGATAPDPEIGSDDEPPAVDKGGDKPGT